ncbi:MAG: HD domain-containing protein [Chlamydiae bacterium]|nr:HD domain-containing protein [Chlamydiota bacterium]
MTSSIAQLIRSDLDFLQEAKKQDFKTVTCEKVEELLKHKKEYKKNSTTLEEKELYCSLKVRLHELREFKLPYRVYETIKHCVKQQEQLPSTLGRALQTSKLVGTFQCSKIQIPECSCKEDRKKWLGKLKDWLIENAHLYEEDYKILESIHWLHGSNSAMLPLLPYSDYTLTPTGELLDKGIAPMGGELGMGGMVPDGVSQNQISVETIRDLPRVWKYAENISNSFNPQIFEEAETLFKSILDELQKSNPSNGSWEDYLIKLLRLKQWNPELFEQLQKKYSQTIEQIIQEPQKQLFFRESMILEALNYPEAELKQAVSDKAARKKLFEKIPVLEEEMREESDWTDSYCNGNDPLCSFVNDKKFTQYDDDIIIRCRFWRRIVCLVIKIRLFGDEYLKNLINPRDWYKEDVAKLKSLLGDSFTIAQFLNKMVREKVENRIKAKSLSSDKIILRLKNVFEKNLGIKINEDEKQFITSPFPILVGSTKTKCFFRYETSEANISSAKWGEELDIVFVRNKDLEPMSNWLKMHGLKDKVQIYPIETIEPLFSTPLYHSSMDTIGGNLLLHGEDYNFINEKIKSLLHLYQKPYPDGSKREYHGIAHATRTALLSIVITEMYKAQGHILSTDPKNIPIAAFLHDSGREGDGVDRWDKQSGKICEDFMASKLQLPPNEVEILSKGISEKDKEPANSIEQKIIHDADCIEIIRCLRYSDGFNREELWMHKDNFPKTLIDLFLSEAQSLITLTQIPVVKDYLESSQDPFRALLQIMRSAKCFSFLESYATETYMLCQPSDYILNKEIEQAVEKFRTVAKAADYKGKGKAPFAEAAAATL